MIKDILMKTLDLTAEQVEKVVEAMKESKLYTTTEQNIEQRYSKLKNQKTELETQLTAANEAIETLKKSNLANEELQKQVEAYKLETDRIKLETAEKVKTLALDNAINAKLGEFDTKYHTLLKTAFNRDTISVDGDGVVTGLDEQYKAIKDTYSDLLIPQVAGRTPVNPKGKSGITKEEFDKMSYVERMELYNTQPEAYQNLNNE